MAASIGTLTGFTGWKGILYLPGRRMATLPPKPGKKGRCVVVDAWDSVDQEVTTSETVADETAAASRINTARALMDGSTVTVTLPRGTTFSCKVKNVVPQLFDTTQATVRLVMTWTFHVEAVEPTT